MSDFYVSLEVATEMVKSAVLAEREACAKAAEFALAEMGDLDNFVCVAGKAIRARSGPS